MTTQTEALKLALEALEYFSDTATLNMDKAFSEDAIAAIKEALTQEKALQALHDENERLGLYKDAYAQPEQKQNLKLMPREATPEMLKAMDECSTEGYDERLYEGHAGSVYMAAWDAFYGQHCYCGDITNLGVIHRDDGPCHYPDHKEPEQEPEFVTHNVDKPYDWSEWVCPNPSVYLMKCCDCGLVHEAEFGVVRYKSETEREDCDMVDDPNLQAVFRMRRSEKWSPEDTAHRAGGLPMAHPEQEPVAKNEEGRITWLVDDWPQNCFLYAEPPKWTPVEIGVDVTSEGAHVVAMYLLPDAVRYVFYSQFHTAPQPEQEPAAWQRDIGTGRRFMPHGILPSVGKETGWTPLYTTPPKPKELEHEPVAWEEGESIYFKEDQGLNDWIRANGTPLYRHPPQRTWVGLDEEDDIDWEEGGSLRDLVEAVEAKLKEKNMNNFLTKGNNNA